MKIERKPRFTSREWPVLPLGARKSARNRSRTPGSVKTSPKRDVPVFTPSDSVKSSPIRSAPVLTADSSRRPRSPSKRRLPAGSATGSPPKWRASLSPVEFPH
ncbi:hypothetical protein K469DRAFT_703178, partial [Zopfia rhizophila CBS 207.26]